MCRALVARAVSPPSEVDVVALAINLEAFREQMENITAAMNAMSEAQENSVEMANSVLLNQQHLSFSPLYSMSSSLSSNKAGQKEPTSSLCTDKAAAPANIAPSPNAIKKLVVKGSRPINNGSKSIKAFPTVYHSSSGAWIKQPSKLTSSNT